MPITHSASKKLKQDKKRRAQNLKGLASFKAALRTARLTPTPKNLSQAFSQLDQAAKKHLIHKNKAARLKSKLSSKLKDQSAKQDQRKKSKDQNHFIL